MNAQVKGTFIEKYFYDTLQTSQEYFTYTMAVMTTQFTRPYGTNTHKG